MNLIFAPMVLVMLGESSLGVGNCIRLTLTVDGKPLDPVTVELSVAGEKIATQSCPGGFLVSSEIEGHDRVEVHIVAPGHNLDFGELQTVKVTEVDAWDVGVDTPPFVPGYWGVPSDVKQILAIGFVSHQGDGTAMSVYSHSKKPEKREFRVLRDLLLRVDLVEEGRWLCLPAREKWSPDSPVTLTIPDEERGHSPVCESRSFVRLLPTTRLKEVAHDILSEFPEADVAMLFDAIMQEYCGQSDADKCRCRQYTIDE